MSFDPGQLVVCVREDEHRGLRAGIVYRISETVKIAGVPAVAIDEQSGHFFASRFRPISKSQTQLVNSIMRGARVHALLRQMSGKDAA